LEDFGYVGGVVQVDGRYHLYAEHPIGATGPDYGPMSLAIAEDPAGPWTRWEKNPVLEAGKTGAWDAGGFSEAEVLRAGGGFCIFFGGAKLHPERIRSEESIGYAFSADGYRFTKHPDPVARRESVPNTAAMSEVHAIYEPPFVYLYHTLRYREPRRPQDRSRYPHIEDLGVEVIATDHPFKLQMPVLHRENLGPGEATNLFDCPPLCLATLTRAELQAECAFGRHATQGLQIRVHTSEDGLRWGDDAAFRLELPVQRSTTVRGTCVLEPKPRFAKVVVENLDTGTSVSTVRISASVSG
jgi:hypothetical protein